MVSPQYRRQGTGDALLCFLERTAVAAGVEQLFVLSTNTMQWFMERDFDEVPLTKRAACRPSARRCTTRSATRRSTPRCYRQRDHRVKRSCISMCSCLPAHLAPTYLPSTYLTTSYLPSYLFSKVLGSSRRIDAEELFWSVDG